MRCCGNCFWSFSPEDEEELKDWVVKCNININAWAKVEQGNITVGGGTDVWN